MSTPTAVDRVFGTPELVQMIARKLDRQSASVLSRTTRNFHLWIEPYLYTSVLAYFGEMPVKLLTSPDSMRALARNAASVKAMVLGLKEADANLRHCFARLRATITNRHRRRRRPRCSRHSSLPYATDEPAENSELASGQPDTCPYALPADTVNDFAAFEATCWVLQMSDHLVQVDLQGLVIRHQRDFMVLAKAIACLPRLESLMVLLAVEEEERTGLVGPFRAWSDLFFSCQSLLIRIFRIELPKLFHLERGNVTGENSGGDGGDGGDVDGQASVGGELGMPRNRNPLPFLLNLDLPQLEDGATAEDVRNVFERCPNLRSLNLQGREPIAIQGEMARIIATCCPLLKSVAFDTTSATVKGSFFPCELMAAIREQQVVEFRWRSCRYRIQGLGAKGMFLRHSRTLRAVELGMFCFVESEILCTILEVCEALEQLSVQSGHDGGIAALIPISCVRLGDIAPRPWACTKLCALEIAFGIPALPRRPDQEPYYKRKADDTLSTEEQQHFILLERLYRQVGALSELRYLKMKAFEMDGQGRLRRGFYSDNTFPAMLSLGNAGGSGRPGYLECLGGLTKLQRLKGSVYANTDETKVTMGWPEARWMASHWPEMVVAELFPEGGEATAPFMWLMEQRKGMDLVLKTGHAFDLLHIITQ
ncbi:hypothetical protein BGW39_008148 [Mortierella sp. 14UC]|nr:hypothetical protein BGW39_008148 [Mortierella sp. 14UC]